MPKELSQSFINHYVGLGKLGRTGAGTPYIPGALKDLSVSRSSFTWGIPVPEAVQQAAGTTQSHVIYVWLDALANYMTAIGYKGEEGTDENNFFNRYWPANLHVVGKEITRFHCVYWPAFLLAAGLATPKAITANGWLLFDNSKMSKSKGNVVRTETILEAFGEHVYKKHFPGSTRQEQDLFAADVLRYYLLREIPFGQDGSFTFDSMIARYNADLANGYGNLVSRTLALIAQNFPDGLPMPNKPWLCQDRDTFREGEEATDSEVWSGTRFISVQITHFGDFATETLWPTYRFQIFLAELMLRVQFVDGYLSFHKPWKLAKSSEADDRKKLVEVLYTATEAVRLLTAYLFPVVPAISTKVWQQLGLDPKELTTYNPQLTTWGGLKPGTKLGPLSPIFPRADKSLATLMEDLEAANTKPEKAPAMPTTDTTQQPAAPTTHPAEPLKDQGDPIPAFTPDPKQDPTHPAAPPRTASLDTQNPGAQVGASNAITTEREGTPHHSEAHASGIFASTAGTGQPDTPQIAIDDFTKIDLRVAKILVAERIPKADKLLRLEVDLGYEQRQILSGIAEHYTPEELIGRKIVIIANLAPRKMRGLESRGMLLAASEGENGKPVLATFGEEIAVGTRLR